LHSTFSGVLGRLCLFILSPIVKPVVIYCPHAFSFMMTNQKLKKKIYVAIEKILQKNTDAIICVSKYELEESIKYGFDKSAQHLFRCSWATLPFYFKSNC
ncbi:hypothetical protein MAX20_29515, partial [Escherichia coli]